MKTGQDHYGMRSKPQPLQVRLSSRQSGSALIYILIAVALLAALTVSLMEPSNQQAQTQSTTNLVSTIDGQIKFVTSAVQECVLTHPNQDSGLTSTQQKNAPYPINPHDPYLPALTPAASSANLVKDIRCPGNPGGADANHAKIFGGSSGKFMPQPPPLFEDWRYYNGTDGIYIMAISTKSDAFIQAALTRLDGMYSNCEADVINNLSGGPSAITGDSVAGDLSPKNCPGSSICFRYWIKETALASDGVSAGCPD